MAYSRAIEFRNGSAVHLESAIDEWYGGSFATLGDSIVWAGAPLFNRVRSRLGFATYRNLGVSGRPMADGTTAGVGTVTTGLANTFTYDSLVYIASGTNDFKLNVPIGSIGTLDQTTFDRTTFFGAYRTLLDYLILQKPTMQIVLATPLQRNNSAYTTTSTNTAGHKLSDYREAVFKLGEMYSIQVVDMYSLSGINEKNLTTYTLDGLHPNEVGYIQMARVLVGQLRSGGTSRHVNDSEYDSGGFNVSALLTSDWTGKVYVARNGYNVTLHLEDLKPGSTTTVLSLPDGYTPRAFGTARHRGVVTNAQSAVRRTNMGGTNGRTLSIFNTVTTDVLYGTLMWTTLDTINPIAPGTPV